MPDASTQSSRITATEPTAGQIAAQKRRVVKIDSQRPLSGNRQYVDPAAARSAATYDLFTWASKHNRTPAAETARRIRVGAPSQDGLTSSEKARNQKRLQNYFEFGAGNSMRAHSGSFELNVHRNRVIFILALCGLILYSLSWLAG